MGTNVIMVKFKQIFPKKALSTPEEKLRIQRKVNDMKKLAKVLSHQI